MKSGLALLRLLVLPHQLPADLLHGFLIGTALLRQILDLLGNCLVFFLQFFQRVFLLVFLASKS